MADLGSVGTEIAGVDLNDFALVQAVRDANNVPLYARTLNEDDPTDPGAVRTTGYPS